MTLTLAVEADLYLKAVQILLLVCGSPQDCDLLPFQVTTETLKPALLLK